jgi:hypothetical protein
MTQFNPARIISSSADLSKEVIEARPCFLCEKNLPVEQISLRINDYCILCNPYPIFKEHFTIVKVKHLPQSIIENFDELIHITRMLNEKFTMLYNGPACGASAPDHMHFQAVTKNVIPIENDLINIKSKYPPEEMIFPEIEISFFQDNLRRFVFFSSHNKEVLINAFNKFYHSYRMIISTQDEPMMNIISWYKENKWSVIIFPRQKHRPKQFFATDNSKLLISPAVVDLGGLFIIPREEDFVSITSENIKNIFQQVIIGEEAFQNLFEAFRKSLTYK